MRKIRHGNHVKQLTIWLLFLFLGGIIPEAKGQPRAGSGTASNPYNGNVSVVDMSPNRTYYFKGVTDGRVVGKNGSVMILEGSNKFKNRDGISPLCFDQITTIRGKQGSWGAFSGSAYVNGEYKYPGITANEGSSNWSANTTLRLEGPLFVNNYSGHTNIPGIGAGWDAGNKRYGVVSGYIAIKDGAFLNMTLNYNNVNQLPFIKIENFGMVNPKKNTTTGAVSLSDYPRFKDNYPKCFITYSTAFKDANDGWAEMKVVYGGQAYTGNVWVKEAKDNSLGLLPIYFSGAKPDYLTLRGIPVSLSEAESRLGAVTVGGSYYENTNVLPPNPGSDMVLKVNNYPFKGTLAPAANITFDGAGKNLRTTSAGLSLAANSYMLTLQSMNVPTGSKLVIGNKVILKEGTQKCTIADGVAQDGSGNALYYCTSSLAGTISSITYDGQTITRYTKEGNSLRMWLPAGTGKKLRIDMADGSIYIGFPAQINQHYTELKLNRAFDIDVSTITVATGATNHTVTYNSRSISIPSGESFIILGNTTKTNKVIFNGSQTANVQIDNLSIQANVLPLEITGNTTVRMTVTGTNTLVSSGSNPGIKVESGSHLSLSSNDTRSTLTVAASQPAQLDIDNKGVLTLGDRLRLTATNGKFPPRVTITYTSVAPTVQLGAATYYLTRLPSTAGVATEIKTASGNQAISTNRYYTNGTTTTYFWLRAEAANNPEWVFTGSKPKQGNLYYLPSQAISSHNTEVSLQKVAAYIDKNGVKTYFKTIKESFGAATDQQEICLASDQTLAESISLSNLRTGQTATFNLKEFTLTGNNNQTINSGSGTLTISSGTAGTLSGSFTIEGCVYSELSGSKLGQLLRPDGKTVYRTWITDLPSKISSPLSYKITGDDQQYKAATNPEKKKACLWLPPQTQEVTISNVLPTINEPIVSAKLTVGGNHDSNTQECSPLPDIYYGDITVTPGSPKTTVTYGSLGYESQTTLGSDASKRLFITGMSTPDSDNGGDHRLMILNGTGTAYLALRTVNIQPSSNRAAIQVNANADIELWGDNLLRGGSNPSGASQAIRVSSTNQLTLRNEPNEGRGRLYVYGGSIGLAQMAAIYTDTNAGLTIAGGTIIARHGDGTQTDAIEGPLKIYAGSVDALSKVRPTNYRKVGTGDNIYKVAVTTGLNPGEPYVCTYNGCEPATFTVLPDDAGKVYCWLPEQPVEADKTNVTLTHPVSYEKTEIEVVQVETNDDNVAPIVVTLSNRKTGESMSYGNLRDAFDAMKAGTSESDRNQYDLRLLTRINNLRTRQVVPAYTDVYLDLGSFEINTQNGSEVAFDASANSAYLQIGGKGNIKNTFKIKGDIFITGIVPLTDAVVELNGKAVFRTLVKGLAIAPENTYSYSYGEQQNISFYLHEGQACLWLPDYGRSEELRFTVNGTGGSTIEYTAGNITTVTQRTEPIPANPVGVVAEVVYGSNRQSYNTLQEAFNAAAKTFSAGGTNISVRLLTGVSISGKLSASGSFTVDLDGKNLTAASGGCLEIQNGAHIIMNDLAAGMKGSIQADIRLLGTGRLFIPSSIHLTGNVHKGDNDATYYWRTMLNMSYMTSITEVGYESSTYPVINREVCLWLPASDDKTKEYAFTINGKTEKIAGYLIASGKHDNDMTIGGSNNEARIGTNQEFATLADALSNAQNGQTVELLKTVSLPSEQTLTDKNITLELGKYELTGQGSLKIGSEASLLVKSRTGSGKIEVPVILNGGNLYIGQDVSGDGIEDIKDMSNKNYYRLLVSNLPSNIPSGTHEFKYQEIDASGQPISGKSQTGSFMVREGIGCLWLEQGTARRLTFTVAGNDLQPPTNNVTINPDHFNLETYGVSDVAQIRNGKKYTDLVDALKEASGRTVMLLKNAALKDNVSISGSVALEMEGYTITSQPIGSDGGSATITVPQGANLRITGKGSISSPFKIAEVTTGATYSNCNLQVDKVISMDKTVTLNGEVRRRVSIDGLPVSQAATYTYGKQTGKVRTSSNNSLCLWMIENNAPINFYVDLEDGKSYLATQVVITATNANPISLTKVDAVAEVDGTSYDTLREAFAKAEDGNTIKLRKDADNLSGTLALSGDITATLDMEGNTINAANLTLDAKKGQMLVQDGKLTGTLILSGNVFIDGDVSMTNATVAQAKKTVWRTFITLPDATASFSYKLGDEPPVTCTNIHTNADGKPVACLWLPSSNVARTLTVSTAGNEYALSNVVIASTHGNELDITSGNNPVAKDGNNKQFASLASALAGATGTITLMRDLTLGTIQSITTSRTIDLANFRITSTNGGFDINAGTTLTLQRGQVLGTLSLNGDGGVSALGDVKIAGIVLDKNHEEIYRVLVKVKDATQCLWVTTSKVEEDRTIQTNHEVTIPAGLSNHNTTLTAYEVKTLDGAGSWQATYVNTRLKLGANAVLTLPEGTNATLNRLILRDGAKVTGKGQVIATEGIRYVRAITAGKWESIALPFTASRITMATDAGATTILSPAYGNGNAGNFWLRMVSTNGALINVNSPEMTANQFYLIAVPNDLGGKELTFVSGANQLLRRDKVLAVKPASGFAAYANGTLDEIQVSQPCYVLKADGKSFTRVNTATISPFRGYLLADAATTAVTPELRMAGIPTATETIVPGEPLRVSTRRGALTVSTGRSVTVRIYTMNGFPVESFKLDYGERTVFLPTGIYIVNRQKVWVD